MAKRKGAGKLRHMNISNMWVQERQDKGDIDYTKILAAENPSDLMTKHLDSNTMWKHMHKLGLEAKEGRSRLALQA